MTSHDCTSWNVHRETLRSFAHEVDGVRYVGGRGVRLDGLIERTYIDEAHNLGNDLAECLAALAPPVATQVLGQMKDTLIAAAEDRIGQDTLPDAAQPDPVDVTEVDLTLQHPDPVDTDGRGRRRRRRDDAAAALDEERTETSGEIAVVQSDS